jgi:hypothetical protein
MLSMAPAQATDEVLVGEIPRKPSRNIVNDSRDIVCVRHLLHGTAQDAPRDLTRLLLPRRRSTCACYAAVAGRDGAHGPVSLPGRQYTPFALVVVASLLMIVSRRCESRARPRSFADGPDEHVLVAISASEKSFCQETLQQHLTR